MTRFTGTHYDDLSIAYRLTIKPYSISFTNLEYSDVTTRLYKLDTSAPQHYTGVDNSGGKYEKLYFDTKEFFNDYTIIGNGRANFKHVIIQTWDRKEYFISGVQEVKLVGRGKHKRYADSSSHQSTIINMDDESATALAKLFDTAKEQGSKVWR